VSDKDCSAALTPVEGGVYITIHAQPGARREKLCGMHGDALKIAVRQAPQDGRANAAIIDFLAAELDCSRRQLELTSGHASRRKRFFVTGDAARITERLVKLLRDV